MTKKLFLFFSLMVSNFLMLSISSGRPKSHLAEYGYHASNVSFTSSDGVLFGTYDLYARLEIFEPSKIQVKGWADFVGSAEDGVSCRSYIEAHVGDIKLAALGSNNRVFDTYEIPLKARFETDAPAENRAPCLFNMAVDWERIPMDFLLVSRSSFEFHFPNSFTRPGWQGSGASFTLPFEFASKGFHLNLKLEKPSAEVFSNEKTAFLKNPEPRWNLDLFKNPFELRAYVTSWKKTEASGSFGGSVSVLSEGSTDIKLTLVK